MPRPLSPALLHVLPLLRCPVCGADFPAPEAATSLDCPTGHSFNIAKQGYVSLVTGSGVRSGDDADMAAARDRFLGAGPYAPIREFVAELGAPALNEEDSTVLDVGCGTGYYLAGLLDAAEYAHGIGVDSSTRSLRRAARAHEHAAAAAWDVFADFPLDDASIDLVCVVFSPRNIGEFQRILKPTGRLLVVRPTGSHLQELRDAVPTMVDVDPDKESRLAASLAGRFVHEVTRDLEYSFDLDPDLAADLVGMTPSARHLEAATVADMALPASATVSVKAGVYAPVPTE